MNILMQTVQPSLFESPESSHQLPLLPGLDPRRTKRMVVYREKELKWDYVSGRQFLPGLSPRPSDNNALSMI